MPQYCSSIAIKGKTNKASRILIIVDRLTNISLVRTRDQVFFMSENPSSPKILQGDVKDLWVSLMNRYDHFSVVRNHFANFKLLAGLRVMKMRGKIRNQKQNFGNVLSLLPADAILR